MSKIVSATVPTLPRVSRPSFGFWPYLVVGAVPWLFVATVFRIRSHTNMATLVFGTQLVQLMVFMAFLLMSQRMINLTGGGTSLDKLSFRDQTKLGWAVLKRVLGVSVLVFAIAYLAGVHPFHLITLALGIDGIVFPWYGQSNAAWNACVAMLAFLMVVEQGLDRPPTLRSVAREFGKRGLYILLGTVAVWLFLSGANALQRVLTAALEPYYAASAGPFQRYFYTGYFLGTAYIRLWITVAILTYALRASYRQQ